LVRVTDFIEQSPSCNKNTVIPGYQGHLPKIWVENTMISKRLTEQCRDIFNDDLDNPREPDIPLSK